MSTPHTGPTLVKIGKSSLRVGSRLEHDGSVPIRIGEGTYSMWAHLSHAEIVRLRLHLDNLVGSERGPEPATLSQARREQDPYIPEDRV